MKSIGRWLLFLFWRGSPLLQTSCVPLWVQKWGPWKYLNPVDNLSPRFAGPPHCPHLYKYFQVCKAWNKGIPTRRWADEVLGLGMTVCPLPCCRILSNQRHCSKKSIQVKWYINMKQKGSHPVSILNLTWHVFSIGILIQYCGNAVLLGAQHHHRQNNERPRCYCTHRLIQLESTAVIHVDLNLPDSPQAWNDNKTA